MAYQQVNKEEIQYLNHIKDIISNGYPKLDRTGTGTNTKIGLRMEFNLRKTFPLLTTKKIFFRGVVEELLWFIKADTNSKNLSKKGVKIWDANSSRPYLDKIGLKDRKIGDLGPIYGFQWRHFGAPYVDCDSDYKGKGIDQLRNCINLIKNNPYSRRIVMSAWNPTQTKEMALPPCHILCQFFVFKGELSSLVYLRSGDMGLGVPFNIASYALLTCMIAQVCGLKRGSLIQIIGDAHVYKNHVEPLKEQLKRVPRKFPELIINNKIKNIDEFRYEDIKIVNYKPYPSIKMKMSV